MVVENSDASIGVVPPPCEPAVLRLPSPLTMTQLLPVAPGVVVKLKPVKLDASCICALFSPVAPVSEPPPALGALFTVVFQ